MDYEAQYEQARQMAEQALKESLLDMGPHQELLQAMRYSLLAGGKRLRPVFVFDFLQNVRRRLEAGSTLRSGGGNGAHLQPDSRRFALHGQ